MNILKSLALIIPISLPISLNFSSFYFNRHLSKKGITVSDSQKLNVSGRVNIIVVDKTGTLTEDKLDLIGFQTTFTKKDLFNEISDSSSEIIEDIIENTINDSKYENNKIKTNSNNTLANKDISINKLKLESYFESEKNSQNSRFYDKNKNADNYYKSFNSEIDLNKNPDNYDQEIASKINNKNMNDSYFTVDNKINSINHSNNNISFNNKSKHKIKDRITKGRSLSYNFNNLNLRENFDFTYAIIRKSKSLEVKKRNKFKFKKNHKQSSKSVKSVKSTAKNVISLNNNRNKIDNNLLELDEIETDVKVYGVIHREFWKKYYSVSATDQNDMLMDKGFNIVFFFESLAVCHTLRKLDNSVLGNTIDKLIFDQFDWEFKEKQNLKEKIIYTHSPPYSYKITDSNSNIRKKFKLIVLKRFPFNSKHQSNSVISMNNINKKLIYFIKGAPEKIVANCNIDSLPANYKEILVEHTFTGCRVIALGFKFIEHEEIKEINFLEKNENTKKKNQHINRLEENLNFLGFVLFKNKLKIESRHTITKLLESNLRIIMSTGDNVYTSLFVAKECEMFKHDEQIYLLETEILFGSKKIIKISSSDFDYTKEFYLSIEDDDIYLEEETKILDKKTEEILVNNDDDDEDDKEDANNSHRLLKKPEKINNKKSFASLNYTLFNYGKKARFIDLLKLINNDNISLSISGDALDVLLQIYRRNTINERIDKSSSFFKFFDCVINKSKIFFRMTPDTKVELIKILQEYDRNNIVAMCGDGANDSGALIQADIGVLLNKNDILLTDNHYHCPDCNIKNLDIIIKAGRAAFENSSIIIKSILLYNILNYVSTILLFSVNLDFINVQKIFIDFIVVIMSCFLSSK